MSILNYTLYVLSALLLCSCAQSSNNLATPNEEMMISKSVDSLLALMSIDEKIGQMSQRGTSSRTKVIPENLKMLIRGGKVGSLLNVMNPEHVQELQKIAVEESPHGIPIIFARDVIHGFKTIFPIPLGQAATFNPELVRQGSRIAAEEASARGIRWTFAPMLDISRDPRWGRIAESAGEDPWLTEMMAQAYIEGFQGDSLNDMRSVLACAKHFAGYGAAEGGRDYNTVSISEDQLFNVYLRPFKKAVSSDVATFMSAFNDLNGIPASGNSFLMKDILRDQWNFNGFVVSDWNSVTEMIDHGYASGEKDAAFKSVTAGLNMEMTSQSYENHLKELVEDGSVSIEIIDQLVKNILTIKFRQGLFDKPYFESREDEIYATDHLLAAKVTAAESMVLLKNSNDVLPLDNQKSIALIGPLAHAPHDQLGTWSFDGEKEHTITPLMALKKFYGERQLRFVQGLKYSRDHSSDDFMNAVEAARSSDVVVFVGGEEAILSGEAHSRANIDLPGAQEDLIKELSKTGKPIILVIMAGRPITIGNIIDDVDAVICAWHPGTMGGEALADIISGEISPSGRLPITWPKEVGQVPIYYNHKNTGRPADSVSYVHLDDIPIGAWQSSLGNNSHYLDAGFRPMFPFGFGLSYSKIAYRDFRISSKEISMSDSLSLSITISNHGKYKVMETVQLYVQDTYASFTRPVKELLRFKKMNLEPGQSRQVTFTISTKDLAFYTVTRTWETEAGTFNFWIGKDALDETNVVEVLLSKEL